MVESEGGGCPIGVNASRGGCRHLANDVVGSGGVDKERDGVTEQAQPAELNGVSGAVKSWRVDPGRQKRREIGRAHV